jgi:hypothetical protein
MEKSKLMNPIYGGTHRSNRDNGTANRVPVFVFLKIDGIVKVDVVKGISAKTLLTLTTKLCAGVPFFNPASSKPIMR